MKKIHTLQLIAIISIFWAPWLTLAQDIQSLPSHVLSEEFQIKGLYQLQADDGSNKYLKEQKGELILEKMVVTDESFYFWVVENIQSKTFQLYSAKQQGKLVAINAKGIAKMVTDYSLKETKLVFRMPSTGPKRSKADTNTIAIGYISTLKVSDYLLPDCQCNKIQLSNGRFRVLGTTIERAIGTTTPVKTPQAIENSTEALRIYPNPANAVVNYSLNVQEKDTANIFIYNLNGKQLVATTKTTDGKEILQGQIHIEQLPAGMYILKLQLQNGETLMKKVVKK
ncbi:T9SS type A sorting domain-containing protein [Kordia sp. TARA_039_SRF]|nr:T9SS type A sorting domain-containing protein [Kordia sp. TARA_039_SRF]